MITLDGFGSVAATTMITLAVVDLHVELVAAAAAWLSAWWLLREPAAGGATRAGRGCAPGVPPVDG